MAQDSPVNQSGTADLYCTADHVALVRREEPYGAHESRGRTTKEQVETIIRWICADIDRRTGQSWRSRRSGVEFHDIKGLPDGYAFIRIKLKARNVLDLAAASGDALEIRAGGAWEDYLATRTQGVAGDFWVQGEDGVLNLRRRYWGVREDAVRINYRSGATYVPEDIQEAAALLAAARLEETTIRAHPDAGGAFAVENRARAWKADAAAILVNYVSFGGLQ